MDELDRKILIELDKNVRNSNSRIARSIRTSKDVVNYRIARLQRDGILTGFYALPALGKMGRSYYKLLLKFQSLGATKEKEMIEWLGKRPEVVWVGSCDGNWNAIVTIHVRGLEELERLLEDVYRKYGKFLSRKEVFPVVSIHFFNEKYLYPKGRLAYRYIINFLEKPEEIDRKDEILLRSLTENSRASISDIAKQMKLTPEAAAKRLKNLFKRGLLIALKPRISFTKLGYDYFHVFLSAKTPEMAKDIVAYYTGHPDCVYILEHAGRYDMHMEFVVKNAQKFREILKDLRDRFGDKIHEYEPLQIYTEYKINLLPS
jgi:DNA-binding Lrp family transcriptional regulator